LFLKTTLFAAFFAAFEPLWSRLQCTGKRGLSPFSLSSLIAFFFGTPLHEITLTS
jgi:hypothetical protein